MGAVVEIRFESPISIFTKGQCSGTNRWVEPPKKIQNGFGFGSRVVNDKVQCAVAYVAYGNSFAENLYFYHSQKKCVKLFYNSSLENIASNLTFDH